MNENENIQNEEIQQETPAVEETNVVAASESTGLSTGQKAAGLGILALALYGLYKLIRGAVCGVKSLFQKGKKKLADHKAKKAADDEADDFDPDDIVSAEELPDEK